VLHPVTKLPEARVRECREVIPATPSLAAKNSECELVWHPSFHFISFGRNEMTLMILFYLANPHKWQGTKRN
jgi:hypothetical protein